MKKQFYLVEFKKEEAELSRRKKIAVNVYDFAATLAFSVFAVAVILIFLFRVATVDGSSMNPTLNDTDRIVITNISTEYEHGDIVVIYREDDVPLIKRVIAIGGDTIDIDFTSGTVYLNGEVQTEDYIIGPTYLNYSDGPQLPLTVPEGFVFVMGDNRNNSLDSRSGSVGLVNIQRIVGKMIKTEAE